MAKRIQILTADEEEEVLHPETDIESVVGLSGTIDEFLSTLGTAMNGTFEKVWDDVNKKYTFTFTPGT